MAALQKLSQYGKSFQLKVIGSLLTDKKFLLDVRDVLHDEYFDSEAHKWIVQEIVKYFDHYHTTPTMEALAIELKKVDNDVLKVAVRQELKNSYSSTTDDLEYVQDEFSTFAKNQELKNALIASADYLEKGDYDGIRHLIEQAMKAGMDKNIGHEYEKDVESRYREDARPTVPTPWPIVNQLTQGGFGAGDLAIIFGNPGGGKSWMMVAIAAHALKMGKNVIYYTLELAEGYVGKRFDCNLTGYSIEEVERHRNEIEITLGDLPGRLIIKEYPPKTATIGTIKSHYHKCVDMDFKADLIIIDYLDYLKVNKNYTERKDGIDDVYVEAKSLARQLNIPVVSPSQVNRSGAKDQVIEGDKAAGSYDKIMVSDICISLSRQKEDKVNGTGRIHFMKNRYGRDGLTFNALVNTDNGHIVISDTELSDDELPELPQKTTIPGIDTVDKKLIANRYFQLEVEGKKDD